MPWDLLQNSSWGFGPGASRAPQGSDQSFHGFLAPFSSLHPFYFQIRRLPPNLFVIRHLFRSFFLKSNMVFFQDFLRSYFMMHSPEVIGQFYHRFRDRTSLQSEIGPCPISKREDVRFQIRWKKSRKKGLAKVKARKKSIYKSVGTLVRLLLRAAAPGNPSACRAPRPLPLCSVWHVVQAQM